MSSKNRKSVLYKLKTWLLPVLCLLLVLAGCGGTVPYEESFLDVESQAVVEEKSSQEQIDREQNGQEQTQQELHVTEALIDIDGSYTTAEDVALYIYLYDELPQNFMTKKEAKALGWSGGSLEEYAPGMCIGGDYFGNYEGLLPEEKGRDYYECDIDTLGADSRGEKRIVYSNDGLIYYTENHYESFELLYGEEEIYEVHN